MTQQEAYQEVAKILRDMKEHMDRVDALAKEHGLIVAAQERDGIPEALNPKFYELVSTKYGKQHRFRTDLTEDEIMELAEICGGYDLESARKYLLGEDPYAVWVPSQFC